MFPLEVKTTLGDTVCFLSGCVMSLQESKTSYSDSRPPCVALFLQISCSLYIFNTAYSCIGLSALYLHFFKGSVMGLCWRSGIGVVFICGVMESFPVRTRIAALCPANRWL